MGLQTLVNGVMVGGLYALIAIGFSLVFSILDIVNFAHGSFYMVGAVVALVLHVWIGLPFWVAFAGGLLAAALVGVITEWLSCRPLRLRQAPHIAFLLSTLGMQLVLDNGALLVFGARTHPMPSPVPDRTFQWFNAYLSLFDAVVLVTTLGLLIALELFLRRTRTGKAIRATAQNRMAAGLMGVDVNRINSITFAISAVLGAASGILVGIYYNSVYASMGFLAGLKGFVAAVLGGMGSLTGAVLGGFVLGILENAATAILGAGWRDATAFAVLILVLLTRPGGLLGSSAMDKV